MEKFRAHIRSLPLTLALGLFAALPAAAQTYGLDYTQGTGLPMLDVRTLVANVIRGLMGLLGLIIVSQIIWGGFLIMTHGGNEDRKDKANAHMKHAVVGLVIVLSSASVVQYVVKTLFTAAGLGSGPAF